jgi:hypothetical protein
MRFLSVHELGTFDIALPNKDPASRSMFGPFLQNLAMHEDNMVSKPRLDTGGMWDVHSRRIIGAWLSLRPRLHETILRRDQ